jgi:hypothetical protein
MLTDCKQLQTLSVANNRLGDGKQDGILLIAAAVKDHPNLRDFDCR